MPDVLRPGRDKARFRKRYDAAESRLIRAYRIPRKPACCSGGLFRSSLPVTIQIPLWDGTASITDGCVFIVLPLL